MFGSRGNLNIRLVPRALHGPETDAPSLNGSYFFDSLPGPPSLTMMIAIVFLMQLNGRTILVEIPGRSDFLGLYSSPPCSWLIHSLMYGGQRTRWIPVA